MPSGFFDGVFLSKFIFRANLYTDAAYTSAPDILEIVLHITGAFFGVKIPFSVRCRGRSKDCACRASRLAGVAIFAPVFDDGKLICEGHVCDHGRKTHFTAIFFGEEKSAFSDKTKPRKYRRRLVRKNAAVGVIFPQTLAGGNGQGGKAYLFNFTRKAEGDLVE